MTFLEWLNRLFECKACVVLERENARLVRENEVLLSRLLEKPKEVIETSAPEIVPKEINAVNRRSFVTSQVRHRMIEESENQSLAVMKMRNQEIKENAATKAVEELERDLGVDDAVHGSNE